MAATYPPFVNAYKKIPDLFKEIQKAAVPSKFTNDFVTTKLGLKSSSFRAMIPLLKKLGIIDNANVPTDVYKKIKDVSKAGGILAQQIKSTYADLFSASEFAQDLSRKDLTDKLISITGAATDDKNIPNVAGTFIELCKLANFDSDLNENGSEDLDEENEEDTSNNKGKFVTKNQLGIGYTINLNLPATTDIEVFNSIFKSLKEHILGD